MLLLDSHTLTQNKLQKRAQTENASNKKHHAQQGHEKNGVVSLILTMKQAQDRHILQMFKSTETMLDISISGIQNINKFKIF